MPRISLKNSGHRGVEALFSSSRKERDVRVVIGAAGVVVGVALWTIVVLDTEFPQLFGISIISSYLSLTLSSMGLLFATCGSGIIVAFSLISETRLSGDLEAESGAEFPTSRKDRESSPAHPSRGDDHRGTSRLLTPNLRLGLIAFVQSCALITLYAGLVEEYRSNLTMQHWVRSVLPFGDYVLNWWAVTVISGILGLLVVQFLPRGVLAE